MPMLTLTPPRCHCLCQNLHTLQGPAAWGRVNETSSVLPFPVINNQLGLQHGLLDASSSNTVKFPEAALAGRAWSHVQRCPWGVWGPSPLERVPLLLCPFLYVCVFAPTLLESKPHQSQERAIIILLSYPQGLIQTLAYSRCLVTAMKMEEMNSPIP